MAANGFIGSETKTIIANVNVSKAVGDYGMVAVYLSTNYLLANAVVNTIIYTAYNGDIEVDISSISGDYYLVIALATWGDVAQIKGVVCKYSDVRLVN